MRPMCMHLIHMCDDARRLVHETSQRGIGLKATHCYDQSKKFLINIFWIK